MSVALLFDDGPDSRPSLSVFSPPDSGEWAKSEDDKTGFSSSQTRITNPGLTQNSVLELLESLRESEKDDMPEVTDEQRNYFHSTGTLAEFYVKILDPWRRRQRTAGKVAAGTLTNERQSIRCYEDFDKASRPQGWPLGVPWAGRPIGFIAANYLREWILHRLQFGNVRGSLSSGSMPKRWNHLRFILNQAFRLKIIDNQISISVDELVQQFQESTDCDSLDDLDLIPTSYTDDQLHAVYRLLDGDLELQTAWVLGAQTGPRTCDLFGLRWQKNLRMNSSPPELIYIAEKTKRKKRRIWVPLGPIAVDHLKRLERQQAHLDEPQGLVFARLTDGQRRDPEDGERSRARTRRIKRAIADAGIPETPDTERPWQMLRATANSRLNGVETKAGDRATHGKDPGVQGQSYTDYRDMLIRAVNELDRQRLSAGIFCK